MNNSFWKAGHAPTLFAAFLYFDLSFMVWYVLGPLGVQIAGDLQLSTQQRAMMVATPILAGAVLRFLLGLLADRWSPKSAGILAQVIVIAALAAAWLLGVNSYAQALLLGLFLASPGHPSPWPCRSHRNGTRRNTRQGHGHRRRGQLRHRARRPLRPRPGRRVRLEQCVRLRPAAARPDPPGVRHGRAQRPAAAGAQGHGRLPESPRRPRQLVVHVLLQRHLGGFLGLASTLPGYFHDQYGLNPVTAGYYTAACVFAGSLMRPLGGALADRIGGIRSLLMVYTLAAICIAAVGFHLSSAMAALGLFVVAMLSLGAGNGAVFQLVPQRFHKEIGVMTGLIGMAGGIGGFCLTAGLGAIKQSTGDYQLGLWLFASLGVLAWFGLHGVKRRWRTTWGSAAVTAARV